MPSTNLSAGRLVQLVNAVIEAGELTQAARDAGRYDPDWSWEKYDEHYLRIAEKMLHKAERRLIEALMRTPCGQHGAAHITDQLHLVGYIHSWERNYNPPSRNGRVRSLLINSRVRAQVVCGVGGEQPRVYAAYIRDAESAFQQKRRQRQLRLLRMYEERTRLIRDLTRFGIRKPRNFGQWVYLRDDGGGAFYRPIVPEKERILVRARGALKAALPDLETPHLDSLEAEWDRKLFKARY